LPAIWRNREIAATPTSSSLLKQPDKQKAD